MPKREAGCGRKEAQCVSSGQSVTSNLFRASRLMDVDEFVSTGQCA